MQKAIQILACAVLLTTPASAEVKHLVTGNDYKPFTDEDMKDGGLVTAIVREAYAGEGHGVKVSFTSWKRGARMVETGKASVHFPLVKTEARLKKFAYSEPVFVSELVPAVRPEDRGTYTSMAALKNGKTCMPIGWAFGVAELDEARASGALDVERPDEMGACYRLLAAGRVDYLVLDAPTINIDAKTFLGDADKVRVEDFKLGETRLHAVFDKDGDPAEVAAFNEALAALKASGRYQALVTAYLD